jgi:phosphatidylserine/phosphatidylglycerophosphate/cardiolipin synthase-like enzyme
VRIHLLCSIVFSSKKKKKSTRYGLFMKHGIRVFEMKQQALHAKLCVIDDVYVTVGSFNLDVMSNTRNLEVCWWFFWQTLFLTKAKVSMHILDSVLAEAAGDQVLRFISGSKEITYDLLEKRSWTQKIGHWLAYMVARLPQVHRSSKFGSDDVS